VTSLRDHAAERLSSELGADRVRMNEVGCAGIDGPTVVATPRSAEEVAQVMRVACDHGFGVVPVGGDCAPRRATSDQTAVALSLDAFDSVVEHAADDLILTAQAGVPVATAQEVVGVHQHQVPVSAPFSTRATLGGVVACAAEGATFATYGAVRDQVLGIQVVHGDGRITRAGGRVVKNVTGYDLCRLYTGSRGVLGVITEVTLRLRPIERSACRLIWRFDEAIEAWNAGMTLRDRLPAITALHLIRGRGLEGCQGAGVALVATLRGPDDLVEALGDACWGIDLDSTAREVAAPDSVPTIAEPVPEGGAWLRIGVLPADGDALLETLGERVSGAPDLVFDLLGGICDVTHADPTFLDPVDETALGADLVPLGARVDRPNDPRFHVRRFHLFPSTRPHGVDIMQRLMTALDPHHVLNPGRFEVQP